MSPHILSIHLEMTVTMHFSLAWSTFQMFIGRQTRAQVGNGKRSNSRDNSETIAPGLTRLSSTLRLLVEANGNTATTVTELEE